MVALTGERFACNKIDVNLGTRKGREPNWERNLVSLWKQSSRFRSKGLWSRRCAYSCIHTVTDRMRLLSWLEAVGVVRKQTPHRGKLRQYLQYMHRRIKNREGEGGCWSGVGVLEAGEKEGRGLRKAVGGNALIRIWFQSLRREESQAGIRKRSLPSALESLPHSAEINCAFPKAQQGRLTQIAPAVSVSILFT